MAETSLQGRGALITGGNRGLGLRIAQAYLAQGAEVFLTARDASLLDQAVAQLTREYPTSRIEAMAGDVGDGDDAARIADAAFGALAGLDILVNNAGVYGPMGPLEDNDWRAWTAAVQTNLFGSVLMLRAVLPRFKAKGFGKIVQLSGGGATNPLPRISAYAASKAAIVRLIETVAIECQDTGIDANCIAPGALNTGMLDEVLQAGRERVGDAFYDSAIRQRDAGGAGLDRGAELAVFLASRASDGVTGKLISAVWDRYTDWPAHLDELRSSDVYTLRRIAGRDRQQDWGDR